MTITLDFNWLYPVIGQAPNGDIIIGLCQPNLEEILGFPVGSLPGEELQAKFVLAHEIGHAFHSSNDRVFTSFVENVTLPPAILAGFNPNPLISRNAGRSGFQFEVFSDTLASRLYSPALLNEEMRIWIDLDMRGELR